MVPNTTTTSLTVGAGNTPLLSGTAATEFGAFSTNNGISTVGVPAGSTGAFPRTYFVRSHVAGSNVTDAVTNNDYLQFTITPTSGYQLDLSSISWAAAASGYAANATPPNLPAAGRFESRWTARSSLDGFTTDIGSSYKQSPTTAGTGTSPYEVFTFALGSAFQNLTSTITFRLYASGSFLDSNGAATGVIGTQDQNGIHRLDNLIVNGEVEVIPEPASAIALMAMSALLLRRRS